MKLFVTLFTILSIIISIPASAQRPYYVPANGLAAWYSFNGNASDSSGNANHFTVYGATTLTTDRFGMPNRAYNFSGTSGSHLRIPSSFNTTLNTRNSSFTISAWFKLSRLSNPGDMQIFWRGDGAPATDQYMLYFTGGVPAFRRDINMGTTSNSISYPSFTADTVKFHHLAGVYDSLAGTMSLYLDGTAVTQSSLSGNSLFNTFNFYNSIGATETGTTQNFAGKLDDIGLWSRALSSCEISKLYYGDTTMITQQPSGGFALVGSTATFSIGDINTYAVYQWQIDSTGTGYSNLSNTPPYSGVTTKTLTITNVTARMNGFYYRCIRSGNGCTNITGERRLTVFATGVQSFEKASGFSIYPNPNVGRFNLSSDHYRGNVTLEIGDITGRRLFQQEYNIGAGAIQADLRNKLVPGTYTLRLTTSEGAYATQIIIR